MRAYILKTIEYRYELYQTGMIHVTRYIVPDLELVIFTGEGKNEWKGHLLEIRKFDRRMTEKLGEEVDIPKEWIDKCILVNNEYKKTKEHIKKLKEDVWKTQI